MTRELIVGIAWGFVGGYVFCYLLSLRVMLNMVKDYIKGKDGK